MGRPKNDGRGRIGGRKPGSPNKVTKSLRAFIADVIDENRSRFTTDLNELEARDRLMILERLMSYVIPKQQTITAKIDADKLTDDQVNDIVKTLKNG